MTEYLATGFAGLDRTGDPDVYVRCLRYLGALPGMRAIKDASLERLALAPGASVLDVGCGLGVEAAALAQRVGAGVTVGPGGLGGTVGLAVGLDASQTMLGQAIREQHFRCRCQGQAGLCGRCGGASAVCGRGL